MSKLSVTIDGRSFDVEVHIPPRCDGTELTVIVDGQELQVAVSCVDDLERIEWVLIEGRAHELLVDRDLHWLRSHTGLHNLEVHDLDATVGRPASGDGRVKAPIPGLITRVLIAAGDRVEVGQPILVLEAMKMENGIRAPRTGIVSRLAIVLGQGVVLHEVLAEIT
jgi:biotin carboxyl carrier protein